MHMNVVKRFGGVAAVLVATGRKGMTLILSFFLFPKAFSWYYPTGATLVLGGLLVASLYKMQKKKKTSSSSTVSPKKLPSQPLATTVRHSIKMRHSDLELASPPHQQQ